jgi:hypothetical protein
MMNTVETKPRRLFFKRWPFRRVAIKNLEVPTATFEVAEPVTPEEKPLEVPRRRFMMRRAARMMVGLVVFGSAMAAMIFRRRHNHHEEPVMAEPQKVMA